MQINKSYSISSLILLFLTPWILYIAKQSIILLILSFILTGLLLLIFNKKVSLKIYSATVIFFLFFYINILVSNFDQSILHINNEQLMEINARRNFYPEDLGRIFHNKVTVVLNNYQQNLFFILDPGFYFFSSHPREVNGGNNIQMFSPLLMPFLLIGIYICGKNKPKDLFLIFITSSFISGFVNYKSILSGVVFFPLISALIIIGLNTVVIKAWSYLK